jgi:hypothetical protein
MDPLWKLVDDLKKHGAPDFAWVIEHAPDGDLDAALAKTWGDSTDPLVMIRFASAVGRERGWAPPKQRVRALVAAARDATKGFSDPDFKKVFDLAERWYTGKITAAQLNKLSLAVRKRMYLKSERPNLARTVRDALIGVRNILFVVLGSPLAEIDSIAYLGHVLAPPGCGYQPILAAHTRLADALRTVLTPPTTADILAPRPP